MLANLLRICADGSYKIIEIRELEKAMLPRYGTDAHGVGQIITFLASNELIDVKYNDENVYCIAVLPKARIYEENRQQERKQQKPIKWWMYALFFGGCFAAAFLGAFVTRFIK